MSVVASTTAFTDYIAGIPNLVAWWPLDDAPVPPGTAAITWRDASGNDMPMSTGTGQTPNLVTRVPSLAPFDQSPAAAIPTTTRMLRSIPALGNNWTIGWLFRSARSQYNMENANLAAAQRATANPRWVVSAAGGVNIGMFVQGTAQGWGPGFVNAADGGVHLLVATWDGTAYNSWVDGAPSGASPWEPPSNVADGLNFQVANNFALGFQNFSTSLEGTYAHGFIVARALSAQEVTDLWAAYNAPPDFGDLPLTYPRAVLSTPWLRHYWRLGGSGPWEDSVGGATATAIPGTGSITPVPGVIAADDTGGLSFTGNARADTPSLPGMSVFSMVAVVKTVIGVEQHAASMTGTGGLGLRIGSGGAFWIGTAQAGNVQSNQPTQLVSVFDGTSYRGFLNDLPASPSVAGVAWSGGFFRIGTNGALSFPFTGTVDEVAIFSTALDAGQVARLYQAVSQADVPGPPQNVSATAGRGRITVTWDEPEWDGGAPVERYVVELGEV